MMSELYKLYSSDIRGTIRSIPSMPVTRRHAFTFSAKSGVDVAASVFRKHPTTAFVGRRKSRARLSFVSLRKRVMGNMTDVYMELGHSGLSGSGTC